MEDSVGKRLVLWVGLHPGPKGEQEGLGHICISTRFQIIAGRGNIINLSSIISVPQCWAEADRGPLEKDKILLGFRLFLYFLKFSEWHTIRNNQANKEERQHELELV